MPGQHPLPNRDMRRRPLSGHLHGCRDCLRLTDVLKRHALHADLRRLRDLRDSHEQLCSLRVQRRERLLHVMHGQLAVREWIRLYWWPVRGGAVRLTG